MNYAIVVFLPPSAGPLLIFLYKILNPQPPRHGYAPPPPTKKVLGEGSPAPNLSLLFLTTPLGFAPNFNNSSFYVWEKRINNNNKNGHSHPRVIIEK